MTQPTKDKFVELQKLAKPIQDWMMDNFNMLCRIEIDCDGVQVLAYSFGIPMKAKGLEEVEKGEKT